MNNIVYSTDPDFKERCPNCDEPLDQCVCREKKPVGKGGDTVYIQRERKGRKGKTVTTIANLRGDLKALQKELQKHCGAGGTVKNSIVEIQGDQCLKIRKYLEQKGFRVKLK